MNVRQRHKHSGAQPAHLLLTEVGRTAAAGAAARTPAVLDEVVQRAQRRKLGVHRVGRPDRRGGGLAVNGENGVIESSRGGLFVKVGGGGVLAVGVREAERKAGVASLGKCVAAAAWRRGPGKVSW